MILSRLKSGSANNRKQIQDVTKNSYTLEDFILQRDYSGARTLLEYEGNSKDKVMSSQHCVAFCHFHSGDYAKAMELYEKLRTNEDQDFDLNVAVCMFYLGMYEEAHSIVLKIPNRPLKIRLLFHLAHKLNDEDTLMELHGSLRDVFDDQLSLAGLHFLRAQYQDAIDIYKRVLSEHKEFLAINIYVAQCYYKLDYYDMSQEVLDVYLSKYPDSTIAINLKACNRFRLFNGRTAEQEIKNITDNQSFGSDLIKHNLVVFRNGEGSLQVFPLLVDIVPEARLNLAIFYLKGGELKKAHDLIKDIQPNVPHEYILKGVIHAALGQQSNSREHIKNAQQYLHLVGSSASECDTIPGRQSMASAFFLYGQFEEVLVYLNSIRSYFIHDDTFNFNYAQAKAATGYFKEAEELLIQITDMEIRNLPVFPMVLARCHINTGHAEQAWKIFISKDTNSESFMLLQLIANDCYKCGEYWYAAKAFDMLEKLDPNPEYWEGKRGACAGVFYAYIMHQEKGSPPNGLTDLFPILRDSTSTQAEAMLRAIRRYASSI